MAYLSSDSPYHLDQHRDSPNSDALDIALASARRSTSASSPAGRPRMSPLAISTATGSSCAEANAGRWHRFTRHLASNTTVNPPGHQDLRLRTIGLRHLASTHRQRAHSVSTPPRTAYMPRFYRRREPFTDRSTANDPETEETESTSSITSPQSFTGTDSFEARPPTFRSTRGGRRLSLPGTGWAQHRDPNMDRTAASTSTTEPTPSATTLTSATPERGQPWSQLLHCARRCPPTLMR